MKKGTTRQWQGAELGKKLVKGDLSVDQVFTSVQELSNGIRGRAQEICSWVIRVVKSEGTNEIYIEVVKKYNALFNIQSDRDQSVGIEKESTSLDRKKLLERVRHLFKIRRLKDSYDLLRTLKQSTWTVEEYLLGAKILQPLKRHEEALELVISGRQFCKSNDERKKFCKVEMNVLEGLRRYEDAYKLLVALPREQWDARCHEIWWRLSLKVNPEKLLKELEEIVDRHGDEYSICRYVQGMLSAKKNPTSKLLMLIQTSPHADCILANLMQCACDNLIDIKIVTNLVQIAIQQNVISPNRASQILKQAKTSPAMVDISGELPVRPQFSTVAENYLPQPINKTAFRVLNNREPREN